MSDGMVVAVVGASGSVGQDLVSLLGRGVLPVGELRLFGGPTRRVASLEVDGRPVPVTPLPADPAESPLFEDVDLAFFATPPEVTRAAAPALAERGVAVIDIGGALADRAPVLVPAVGPGDLDRFTETRMASSPSAPALVLATVLGPLLGLGVAACRGTVLVSAGLAGRAGVEELSSQVVALFNGQTPPRAVFPTGLAFDLVGQLGGGAAESGWTETELRVAAEVAAATGLAGRRLAVGLAMVPLFGGLAAALHLDFEGPVELEAVRAALDAGERLRLGDPVPGPRRLVGKADVYVGRLREDPLGEGVHLWAAADNLRAGASANAVGIAALLLDEGRL